MNFSIFQYNTHLFLGTVVGDFPKTLYQDEIRRNIITDKLKELKVDFITLEEVWGATSQQYIAKALVSSPFVFVLRDTIDTPFKMGSGLLLLSRHPLNYGFIRDKGVEVPRFTEFERTALPDSLANKGFLTVQVSPINGSKFWLIHTHTQADYNEAAVDARTDNLRQIAERIVFLQSTFGQPVVVVGDMNVAETKDGLETGEYQGMKQRFSQPGLSDAFRTVHPQFSEDPGFTYDGTRNRLITIFASSDAHTQYRLDYVFLDLQQGMKALEAQVVSGFTYEDPEKKQTTDLSDHYPISVKFSVSFE